MASITSAGSGPWATGGTWSGGVAPGDGDTAIIANGHTVTIDSGTTVTVGNAAAPTTPAIQTAVATNGTGILIVDTNATLNLKGDVIQGNATWQFNAGSTLNFVHASANLKWTIGDASSQANSKLVLNGSAGSRVTVTSTLAANASGFGQKDGVAWTNGGRMECTYATFSNIGTSSLPFWIHQGTMTAAMSIFFDNCLFTSCGRIDCTNNYWLAGATFRLRQTTFRTPLDGSERYMFFLVGNGAQTGLTFDRVRMQGQMYLGAQSTTTTSVTWSDVVVSASTVPPLDCTTNPPAGTADLVMLYNTSTSTGNPSNIMNGTITKLLSMRTGNSVNPHAFQITVRQNTTINGGIWEFGADAEAGDQLQVVTNPAVTTTFDISNVIAPPSPGNLGAGTFVNISHGGSSANNRISVQQCTSFFSNVANVAGGVLTENTTGGAGVFTAIRNNIFWKSSAGSAWAVYDFSGTVDNGTFTNVNYNCRYNSTDDAYQPADAKFTSPSPPGTNDITSNPNFVDSTRDFLSWGQSISGSLTTIADVMTEVFKSNDDSGFNTGFTLSAYYTWVRAGYAPQNTAIGTAGNTGGRIGAVDVYTAPASGVLTHMNKLRPFNKRVSIGF